MEFVNAKHGCGRMWQVSKNSVQILWCPHCKNDKGFEIEQ